MHKRVEVAPSSETQMPASITAILDKQFDAAAKAMDASTRNPTDVKLAAVANERLKKAADMLMKDGCNAYADDREHIKALLTVASSMAIMAALAELRVINAEMDSLHIPAVQKAEVRMAKEDSIRIAQIMVPLESMQAAIREARKNPADMVLAVAANEQLKNFAKVSRWEGKQQIIALASRIEDLLGASKADEPLVAQESDGRVARLRAQLRVAETAINDLKVNPNDEDLACVAKEQYRKLAGMLKGEGIEKTNIKPQIMSLVGDLEAQAPVLKKIKADALLQ